MKEVIVLKALDQIKAISQEYRLQIIEAFENQAKTAKQIAEFMGEPHGRVNYHIKTLEKVGIIELVEETVRLGVVEKYYSPVAEKIIIDSTVVALEEDRSDAISMASLSCFERVSKDFYDSLENFEGKTSRKISYAYDYYLTDDEAKQLSNQLSAVVDAFLIGKKEPRANTHRHFSAHMVVPMPVRHDK